MNKARALEIANMVAEDVENDVAAFEGKPFTGRTVAEYFGNHAAAIKALALLVKELVEDKP